MRFLFVLSHYTWNPHKRKEQEKSLDVNREKRLLRKRIRWKSEILLSIWKQSPKYILDLKQAMSHFLFVSKICCRICFRRVYVDYFLYQYISLCRLLGFLQVFNFYTAALATEISRSEQFICASHPYEVEDILLGR